MERVIAYASPQPRNSNLVRGPVIADIARDRNDDLSFG
jgi:hypothetical protein